MNLRKAKAVLKFRKPSGWWGAYYREALPAGNGVLGAALYGGAGSDTVMLTHSGLWWQGSVNVLPDVADKLREVRKSLDENKPRAAEGVLSGALTAKGYRPQPEYPLPLCDLKINMPSEKPVKDYVRAINMEEGEVGVSYKDGATRFERSLFVSRASDMVVMEITKSGPRAIDAEFSLDVHDKTCNRTPAGISKTPEAAVSKYESFFMTFAARSDNGTDFGTVARISNYGGTMDVRPDCIRIRGAEKILILIKPFIESSREKEWKSVKAYLSGIKLTYDKLLKEHSGIHGRLFGSAGIDLGSDSRDAFVEDLIEDAASNGAGAALLEKLWAFGRYLTVSCCSAEGSRPMAPYGLWCGDYKAVSSQIRFGSLQMLYSHIFAGNIPDFVLPVFNLLEANLDDLKKNSARLFGTRGIMVPCVMAPESGLIGAIDPEVLHFTGAAAMMAQMFYEYYLFTDDMKFLKNRALPFMQAAALFYEEFLKVGENGVYESSPSYSPGNTPSNFIEGYERIKLDICKNASVDFSLAKELLTNLIRGSELAGVNKGEIEKWKDMLTRIPGYQVNSDGAAKEYLHAKYADNYASKCLSHLYPVYPGNEFKDSDTEWLKAFSAAAKKRVQGGVKYMTSQSYGRLANTFARLSDTESMEEMLNCMVRCCMMNNLVTAQNDWRGMGFGSDDVWAPYNIEGNLAVTNAVQEMLVQSKTNLIKILPALPEDLRKGNADGIQTRAGAEVALDWDKKKGSLLIKLKSRRSNMIDLVLPQGCRKYKGPGAENYNPDTLTIKNLELPAGKVIALDVKWS